ncbi:hypothetical protein C8R44DRAFT_747879 [Mycena epipterygia]|nr:hypothetical protein C8R44DRAFT_747879 [Mycena epipterygia]
MTEHCISEHMACFCLFDPSLSPRFTGLPISFPADLTTVDATAFANLDTMRTATESAEPDLFDIISPLRPPLSHYYIEVRGADLGFKFGSGTDSEKCGSKCGGVGAKGTRLGHYTETPKLKLNLSHVGSVEIGESSLENLNRGRIKSEETDQDYPWNLISVKLEVKVSANKLSQRRLGKKNRKRMEWGTVKVLLLKQTAAATF